MSSYLHPGINPEFLTGGTRNWPLDKLHSIGYKALELNPRVLDSWESLSGHEMGLLCVNSLPVLITYISGSLSGAIEWRRRRILEKLSGAPTAKDGRSLGMGLASLAGATNMNETTISEIVEPFLKAKGWIEIANRRKITPGGLARLEAELEWPREGPG